MGKKIRRVVTGHDENGVATVIMDGNAECILQRPNRPGVTLTNLWQNTKTPAAMERRDDPVTGPLILQPPKNGSVFRIVQFDPENPDELAKLDGKSAFSEMGAGANIVEGARHPFMHRTDSLDYAVVLTGEIYMMMDEDEYLVKAGDVIIQQGTNHAWSNRGTEPCQIAFILIDAEKG
ncbi:cupin domain-containing protein [Alphaproteobacteria bacterium]|jgi:quercetin dioxygenase-like cupin family protein|nr:cupin domain-containing protein [Alphaproteobacteria bacterium]